MYVDKRLDDVMAVQTLSRLNRIAPGKQATFVLDFRNKAEDILAAFEPYYRTAELSGVTDPNLPHQLREKLDGAQVYLWEEVEAFARLYFSTRADQAFQAHLKQAHERYGEMPREEQELFRRDATTFVSAYSFLSQIVDYADPDLEKLHAFLTMLLPRLRGQDPDPVLIDGSVRLAGYKLVNKREHTLDLEKGETRSLEPLRPGGGEPHEDPKARLSEIIIKIHSVFAGKFSDADIAGWYTAVVGNTVSDERIVAQAKANPTAGQFANGDFRSVLAEAVISALESHHSMSEQMLQSPAVFNEIAEMLLPDIYQTARAAVPAAA